MAMPARNPHYGKDEVALSRDFFPLVAADHSDTLPFDMAAGTPALGKQLRAVLCLADATITLQSLSGAVVTWAMAAGQVHDLGYVVAVNFSADDSFAGYV